MADIQTVKDFWDARPCNIRHSSKEVGTKEYFDEVEAKKFFVEPHIKTFTDFPRWRNKRVLEIGCGLGTAAINFARNGALYTGIELSEESIKLARKRFEVYERFGFLYQGNAEELEKIGLLPGEKFDLIYSFGVIHHTPNPKKIIQQAAKFLHSEGELRIMLYAKDSWKNIMIESGLDQPEAQAGCPIAFTYTKEEVIELLSPEFEVISIEQDHIFPYQIEPYKHGVYVKQPWFEMMPREMFRALERNLGWHLLITAKLGASL